MSTAPAGAATAAPGPLPDDGLVPLRRPGRWALTAVALVLLATLAHGLVTNERFGWGTVARYLLSPDILAGLGRTVALTALGMAFALVVGTALALMQRSGAGVARVLAAGYLWFFRGTPLLVQLLFLYNISALYPRMCLGVPFGPELVCGNANDLLDPFTVAVVGLSLNTGAYTCEIVRSGLLAVDRGQLDAGRALGMSEPLLLRRIVLPQAVRVMVPPVGNEFIGMLKYTSLVSVIALPELLYSAQLVYTRTFETIPLLIVVSFWYLVVTSVLTVGQRLLERRLGRGAATATR